MQKIQLICVDSSQNHAGAKAPADVALFAEELGYERIVIMAKLSKNLFGKIFDYLVIIKRFFIFLQKYCVKDTILFLQYPLPISESVLLFFLTKLEKVTKRNNVKVITLFHDLNELRRTNSKKKISAKILSLSSYMIVHNNKMKSYLEKRGICSEKLISLEIFDYKVDDFNEYKRVNFEKTVIIAGNLDSSKAGYLKGLESINEVNFELYGPNFDEKKVNAKNISYKGIVAASDLPLKLTGGFGLVWDGESIKGCSGLMGNYLRYNNPHKASLYLAACLPIIVWKEAAIAEFVIKNNLGFTVDSLEQLKDRIQDLTEIEYKKIIESVRPISKKLNQGFFIKKVIKKCEKSYKH